MTLAAPVRDQPTPPFSFIDRIDSAGPPRPGFCFKIGANAKDFAQFDLLDVGHYSVSRVSEL